ncbi:hypothetical protein DBV15_09150, partial [Temnothorax longispinosus]
RSLCGGGGDDGGGGGGRRRRRARGAGGVLDVRVARHRNKGVFSTKMQDDLPKSGTVDQRDADEWRYSRTAEPHGDAYVRHDPLRLQRAVHDQLVSRTPVICILTPFRPSPPFFNAARTPPGARVRGDV